LSQQIEDSLSAALKADITSHEDGCASDVLGSGTDLWCLAALLASEPATAALSNAASPNNLLLALGSLLNWSLACRRQTLPTQSCTSLPTDISDNSCISLLSPQCQLTAA